MLIVDDDDRVRRALAELITASDGFTVASVSDASVAIVSIMSASDSRGLARVRTLAASMPVMVVSTVGSAADAATAAGAAAFVEMDGNADALIAALRALWAVPRLTAGGARGDG